MSTTRARSLLALVTGLGLSFSLTACSGFPHSLPWGSHGVNGGHHAPSQQSAGAGQQAPGGAGGDAARPKGRAPQGAVRVATGPHALRGFVTPGQEAAVWASFEDLQKTVGIPLSLALAPVVPQSTGRAHGARHKRALPARVVVLGSPTVLPSWSTIKVPLSIVALNAVGKAAEQANVSNGAGAAGNTDASVEENVPHSGPTVEHVHAAIQRSDNDAAQWLWSSLGTPQQAGDLLRHHLRSLGDEVTVPSTQQTHPPYSSFGQTMWAVGPQAAYAAHLACSTRQAARLVTEDMGSITENHNYGLGIIPGAHFKGGWGPNKNGGYDLRQFGYFPVAEGQLLAVSIAVHDPKSAQLSITVVGAVHTTARWLKDRMGMLRGGQCTTPMRH